MSTPQIQRLGQHDLDALVELDAAAGPWPWNRNQFQGSLELGDRVYGYVQDGELLAFAIIQPVLDEASLLNIAVAASQQGQGIARTFLRSLLTTLAAEGIHKVFLEVRASNQPARALYTRLGFQSAGVRRNYYPIHGGREDADCMVLQLEAA
ncbi:ribosomal protein S18-alanine N-acetyltransferase [Leeia aquatica]|uniref:[Ribosomal protein bS18]-alanine N-acetyltransferase n=1 Tax=Leeia aquatica TaxID=2725557 RepID=A0A847S5E0_9NEIS|nr:ribosomal protein S18-alanine N-acetyltransferase [Leeia aquatica]NLR74005.1 ribosomal protein S18-alanine N-acetyltransferase [Leeia aquatica]